jgi:integrase
VLTKAEAQQVIAQMSGLHQMVAKLLYGSGIRLMECLRLRVKDFDFDRQQLIARDTKGNEDRATMLPQSIAPLVRNNLAKHPLKPTSCKVRELR